MSGILSKWRNINEQYFMPILKGNIFNMRVIWVGVIGILLLILGNVLNGQTNLEEKENTNLKTSVINQSTPINEEQIIENKIVQLLSKVKGAGNVAVSVTLEGGSSKETAQNITKETKTTEEKDTSGGIRTTTESKESNQILMSKENGMDKAIVIREVKPEIKGVMVVADGAVNSNIKADLTKAVATGLGIASYKITVLPKQK